LNTRIALSKFKVIRRRLLNQILQDLAFVAPWPFRPSLHRARGLRIGKDVYIGSLVVLDDAYPEYITVEDHVQLSAGAKILAHDSSFRNVFEKSLPTYIGPVVVKRSVYVGSGALILPGVTIGENTIIGAGAVVSSDIPPRCVATGVPARVVATIDERKVGFLSKKGAFIWKYYEKPRKLTEQEKSDLTKKTSD
jgi:acetyltransferase-like isoleucine patch superfamily enzyme